MRKMFSESQIATIAQSAVSGGTQLYKHVIKNDANETLTIISDVATACTTWSQVKSKFTGEHILGGRLTGPTSIASILAVSSSTGYVIGINEYTYAVVTDSGALVAGTFVSDTVTAL